MEASAALIQALHHLPMERKRCFVGFDGFTDTICEAVDTTSSDGYKPIPTIASFAERIAGFAGKSGNIELHPLRQKIGGNAPILTLGLLAFGQRVTLAGALGSPEIEPIFQPLKDNCEALYSLSPSGKSDAIEFSDGKVIFGKMEDLKTLSVDSVLKVIPPLQSLLENSDLFASVNWTMLPMMNALWEKWSKEIRSQAVGSKKLFFVDLADPEKRSDRDLAHALSLLHDLRGAFDIVLGLNRREAERVAKVLGLQTPSNTELETSKMAESIHRALQVKSVVIHSALFSTDGKTIARGPFTSSPQIKTGAGDNFNAGYINGLLSGFSDSLCLEMGMFTAGYYVRNGRSPGREELIALLTQGGNA